MRNYDGDDNSMKEDEMKLGKCPGIFPSNAKNLEKECLLHV